MILYHGTSEENKIKILKEGFTANYGEYGTCLYLAKSKELARDYGDYLIETFVDDEFITFINWEKDSAAEDRLEVEQMAQKQNLKAICIQYQYVNSSMDYTEVCVFDLSIVEINAENSIDLF